MSPIILPTDYVERIRLGSLIFELRLTCFGQFLKCAWEPPFAGTQHLKRHRFHFWTFRKIGEESILKLRVSYNRNQRKLFTKTARTSYKCRFTLFAVLLMGSTQHLQDLSVLNQISRTYSLHALSNSLYHKIIFIKCSKY